MAVYSTPTDHRVRQMHERFMNVIALFVAHPQAPKSLLPTKRPLNYPAITSQALTALHAPSSDPRNNPPLSQLSSQGRIIIGFVGVQLDGSLPWTPTPTAYSRNGIYGLKHLLTIWHVRTRERNGERHASSIYHLMAFRARFATICWVRSDSAPFLRGAPLARTLTESRLARRQSIWLVCSNRFSSRWCKFCHTPAWCHSHSRREACHPTAAPHFLWKHLPGDAALQDE